MRKWLITLLVLLTLACNFPGFAGNRSIGEAEGIAETSATTSANGSATPEDAAKPTPAPLETPTTSGVPASPTHTATPTLTPTPTVTPTPSSVQPGPPLSFQDPAWELVSWQRVPDTNDWQGILRLHINGGRAPYRAQLENNPIVDGLDVQARWRLCAAMPATVRVWSADGQYAEAKIYVWEIGCGNN